MSIEGDKRREREAQERATARADRAAAMSYSCDDRCNHGVGSHHISLPMNVLRVPRVRYHFNGWLGHAQWQLPEPSCQALDQRASNRGLERDGLKMFDNV